MVMISAIRVIRVNMLRPRIDQHVPPNALPEMTMLVAATALPWIVPSLLWSTHLPQHDQIMIGIVLLGLMCSGATSLGIVPLAALAFVLILGLGQLRLMLYHESIAITLLAAIISLNMVQSILANGRVFVRQIDARGELEEQGQLISLLREFQSSGSDWL